MLEAELDVHLGYEKHEIRTTDNARNGTSSKKIRISFGESEIQVPSDREATFNPILVPKRQNMRDGLENVIVSQDPRGLEGHQQGHLFDRGLNREGKKEVLGM